MQNIYIMSSLRLRGLRLRHEKKTGFYYLNHLFIFSGIKTEKNTYYLLLLLSIPMFLFSRSLSTKLVALWA